MATVHRNKQLMYLSAILFFYFAHIGCLAPFISLHMKHLGFSLQEVSTINLLSALASIILPSLVGFIAEFRSRYKSAAIVCSFVGTVAFIALTFVPRFDKLHYRPLVDFDCDAGLRVEKCVNWDTCRDAFDATDNLTKIKLSNCHYQCPLSGHFPPSDPLHLCFHGHSGTMCVVFDDDSRNSPTEFESHLQSWPFAEIPARSNITMPSPANSTQEDIPRAHVRMCNYLPLIPVSFNRNQYNNITCRPNRSGCSIHCQVAFTSGDVSVTPHQCEEAYGNPTTTFWGYLGLRAIGDSCLLAVVCLLDAMIIWSTADFEGCYGRLHVWAALGMASLAPISGTLLDYYSDMDGRVDFSPSSFLAAGFALMTCALLIVLPVHRQRTLDMQPQVETRMRDIPKLVAEMLLLLIILMVLGTQWGILFTYLPWLTADMDVTFLQTGLTYTLIFGFSVPFLLISKNMVRNIGAANLLVFAFLFYFTTYAGLPFVSNPWWLLPFALMGSFSLCVMWIAAVAYVQRLSKQLTRPGHSLTFQYLLNLHHFGIGRILGSAFGADLIARYTVRTAFCGIGVFSACFAFFFLTIYHTCVRSKNRPSNSGHSMWVPLRHNGYTKTAPIVSDIDEFVEEAPNAKPVNNNK